MDKKPRVVMIPKIRFKFRMEYKQSFSMLRTQFPLRLAYAMSYNKSQSQTLHRVLVDCTEMPFTHGHLYVASSRVRSSDNIAHFFSDDNELILQHNKTVVTNIVYKSLLLKPSIPSPIEIRNILDTPINWGATNTA